MFARTRHNLLAVIGHMLTVALARDVSQ